MQRQGSWIGNRIVIAVVGALLIGGISAAIGWGGGLHPPVASSAQNGGNSSANATATPSGQAITASGTIQRVDPLNNTFSIQENDNTIQLVRVSDATQYTGDAASFSDLQSGAQATVSGTLQVDGSLSAATVNMSLG